MSNNPPTSRADGGAYGDFGPARGRARQQQAGHIGAANQQHDSDRALKQQQRRAQLPIERLRHRLHHRAQILVAARVCGGQLRGQPGHFSLRLLRRNARLEARHDAHVVLGALHLCAGPVERRPKVGLLVEDEEIRRHHADDGFVQSIDPQSLPYDVAIPVEAALPEARADQQHARSDVDGIFVFRQHASEHRLYAEGLKHRRREIFAINPLWRLAMLIRADVADIRSHTAYRFK